MEDAKYQDTRGPAYATFFLPLLQTPPRAPLAEWANAIELHVVGRPENFEMAVRKTIADVDPNLTVLSIVSFGEQVDRNFNQERLIARLSSRKLQRNYRGIRLVWIFENGQSRAGKNKDETNDLAMKLGNTLGNKVA